MEVALCLAKRTADCDAWLRRDCGLSTRVAMALELGIESGGHGHPLFKALEPWEARQIKRRWGEHGLLGSDSRVRAGYELEKGYRDDRQA